MWNFKIPDAKGSAALVTEMDTLRRRLRHSESMQALLLEQYLQYVRALDVMSDQREQTNREMIATHALLLSSTVAAHAFGVDEMLLVRIVIGLAAFGLSLLWLILLYSYDVLKEVKQGVARGLEAHLPAQIYTVEAERLDEARYPQKNHILARSVQILSVIYGVLITLTFTGVLATPDSNPPVCYCGEPIL